MSTATALGELARLNLRRVRTERGMSLARLSAATGNRYALNTLSRIERGDRRLLIDDLEPLAAALGVSIGALLGPPRSQDESDLNAPPTPDPGAAK